MLALRKVGRLLTITNQAWVAKRGGARCRLHDAQLAGFDVVNPQCASTLTLDRCRNSVGIVCGRADKLDDASLLAGASRASAVSADG